MFDYVINTFEILYVWCHKLLTLAQYFIVAYLNESTDM